MTKKPQKPNAVIRPCSKNEFAKYLGVAANTIKDAIKNGRIKAKKIGKTENAPLEIDLTTQGPLFLSTSTLVRNIEEIFRKYDADMKIKVQMSVDAPIPGSDLEGSVPEEFDADELINRTPRTMNEARLQTEIFRAMGEKFDYEKKIGGHIDIEGLKRTLEDIAVRVQKGVMGISQRVAPLIGSTKEERLRITKVIDKESRDILTGFINDLKQLHS